MERPDSRLIGPPNPQSISVGWTRKVRVTSAKKDELQSAIQLVRKGVTEVPLGYQNFRD